MRTEQAVVDDILEQQNRQQRSRRRTPKPYEALEHDVVLWHFVHNQRSPGVDSLLDAGYWIGTIDYRLIRFDEQKKRGSGDAVPMCIHPATMLQMLQFFVPRTPDLERALIQSLWPLLPRTIDHKAEEVTIKILSAMSRYSNAKDLPSETIGRILVSQGLRNRIQSAKSDREEFELVESEIVARNEHLLKQLRDERERSQSLLSEVNRKDRTVAKVEKEKLSRVEEFESREAELSGRLADTTEQVEKLKAKLAEAEGDSARHAPWALVAQIVLPGALLVLAGFFFFRFGLHNSTPAAPWLVGALLVEVLVWLLSEVCVLALKRHSWISVRVLGVSRKIRYGLRWLLALSLATIIGQMIINGMDRTGVD